MKNVFFYEYPIGRLGIAEENGAICRMFFANEHPPEDFETAETTLIRQAAVQLTEYFDRKRTSFDLPLALNGTAFQTAVWQALRTIPFGEVRSYKEVAGMVGNPKASRAVGMANHNNPIAIFVPCHRVVGATGSMTGYAGGIRMKEYLLELEKGQK